MASSSRIPPIVEKYLELTNDIAFWQMKTFDKASKNL